MSADLLRRAAKEMRERAEAATPGPYRVTTDATVACAEVDIARALFAPADAEHIASWHPVVALAVADWLDSVASRCPSDELAIFALDPFAIDLARAYLGGAS